MGLDFIRKTALSHTKAWSTEFRRAADDLFAPTSTSVRRSFLATVVDEGVLQEGDPVIIRLSNDRVLVLKDIYPLAEIEKPSLDLIETLSASHGVLAGFIDETNNLARAVSVHVGDKE